MKKSISFLDNFSVPESLLSRLSEVSGNGFKGELKSFENNFGKKIGAEYTLATSSSTAGLHLAMCALDLKRGDKVICSVNSFVDVPEVVRHFDAEPIFVDIDPETYNMDLNQLEKVLKKTKTKKLRAVIVNHMAGLSVDMERVSALAKKFNIKVVEDCSDSLGATFNGNPVGSSYSDLSIFNLGERFNNKFNGGVLLTNSQDYYNRASLLIEHALINQSVSANYLYDILDIGCDYRMSEYDAIFASAVLKDIDKNNQKRAEIANIYFEQLKDLRHLKLPVKSEEHIYKYFIIEIDKNRDGFARELKARGVEVSLHYIPLHSTKYYKEKYGLKIFDFPNSMNSYQKIMTLPNYPSLTKDDVNYICEKIKEVDSIHI